jgi:hypothetical protein
MPVTLLCHFGRHFPSSRSPFSVISVDIFRRSGRHSPSFRSPFPVIPVMLVSRNPALFFSFSLGDGLRPLTSWRFTHTRPRGNQRLFPLGTLSRPATFSLFTKQELRKVAMGIDPAFNFICNRLRPYSKMLTLPMVHPVPRKLA